jgi:hypothetical protein
MEPRRLPAATDLSETFFVVSKRIFNGNLEAGWRIHSGEEVVRWRSDY